MEGYTLVVVPKKTGVVYLCAERRPHLLAIESRTATEIPGYHTFAV